MVVLLLSTIILTQPIDTEKSVLVWELNSGSAKDISMLVNEQIAEETKKIWKGKVNTLSDINMMFDIERQKDIAGCNSVSCMSEIAGALDVDYVVYGFVAKDNNWARVILKLLDVDNKKIISKSESKYVLCSFNYKKISNDAIFYLLYNGYIVKRSWYNNCVLESEHTYIATKLHGTQNEWYKNGKIRKSCFYENGVKDGRCVEWYENGKQKSDCWYLNDRKTNACREWPNNIKLQNKSVSSNNKIDLVSNKIKQKPKRCSLGELFLWPFTANKCSYNQNITMGVESVFAISGMVVGFVGWAERVKYERMGDRYKKQQDEQLAVLISGFSSSLISAIIGTAISNSI